MTEKYDNLSDEDAKLGFSLAVMLVDELNKEDRKSFIQETLESYSDSNLLAIKLAVDESNQIWLDRHPEVKDASLPPLAVFITKLVAEEITRRPTILKH